MKIYCFGNEFLEDDSLAKEIADEIKIEGIEFIKCNSPEELFLEEDQINILDVVEGISEVILIEDINQLRENNLLSLHDFDLGFFLKLMKGAKQIKKVKIIGIPVRGDKEEIKKGVMNKIKDI